VNDYLGTLIQRARGETPRLRPLAETIYARAQTPAPLPLELDVEVEAQATSSNRPTTPPAATAANAPPKAPRPETEEPTQTATAPLTPQPQAAEPAPPAPRTPTPPPPAPVTPLAVRAQPTLETTQPRGQQQPRSQAPSPKDYVAPLPSRREDATRTDRPRPSPATSPPPQQSRTEPPEPPSVPVKTVERRDTPEQRPTVAPAARIMVDSPHPKQLRTPALQPRQSAASEPPTEERISVSIGRIEVRAVLPPAPAPSPPVPAAREKPPLLSLETYLERRSREVTR
jgi:hypothetical protein